MDVYGRVGKGGVADLSAGARLVLCIVTNLAFCNGHLL